MVERFEEDIPQRGRSSVDTGAPFEEEDEDERRENEMVSSTAELDLEGTIDEEQQDELMDPLDDERSSSNNYPTNEVINISDQEDDEMENYMYEEYDEAFGNESPESGSVSFSEEGDPYAVLHDTDAELAPYAPQQQEAPSSTNQRRHRRRLSVSAKRQQLLKLISTNFHDFHRTIELNRQQQEEQFRQRQAALRAFYFQKMTQLESSFFEMAVNFREKLEAQKKRRTRRDTSIAQQRPTHSSSQKRRKHRPPITYYYGNCFSEEQWMRTFRMSRRLFRWLCGQFTQQMISKHIPLQKKILLVEKRVALALYTLASGDNHTRIANLFRVPTAYVGKIVQRFARVVVKRFRKSFISMPKDEQEYEEIRDNFHVATNMPALVAGVLGYCALGAKKTEEQHGTESIDGAILLEALVDDNLLFRKLTMLNSKPTLFHAKPNEVTEVAQQSIDDLELSCVVISPNFHPLLPWLMCQYPCPSEPHEYDFNEAIGNLIDFKEKAFNHLFARWRILYNNTEQIEPKRLRLYVTACAILHNLLEENETHYFEEWSEGIDTAKFDSPSFEGEEYEDDTDALEIRDFLALTISSTEM